MATDVSVVVVSYNTCALLRACLQSVYASTLRPREVFVVDNGSTDGSPAMVAAEFPHVLLTPLDRNLGFSAANNVALRRCRSAQVLLLNPDATLAPEALARLHDALEAWPDAAAVGPRILNPDGTPQSCGYVFPTLLAEIRQSKRVDRLLALLAGPARATSGEAPAETAEVDWCDGACMLLRREALETVGLLDEQYFLYTEELDWCFAARRAGWRVAVVPDAVVWHHRGQSSTNTGTGALSTALLVETRLRYYRKNHSFSTALAAAFVLAAGFAKQWRSDPHGARAKLQGVRRWLAACAARPHHAHSQPR
jgi:N-acetylglucosaminyl-diphospho-decaprenol L-rhamnosyltransferase